MLGDLKCADFKEKRTESVGLFERIRSTYLQILGESTELQESMKFSPFEDRISLMAELQQAVKGERDAYKMLAEQLLKEQKQALDSSQTFATASSTSQEQEREKHIDGNAAAASEREDADPSSSVSHLLALVSLGQGRQLQEGASSPVLKLVGAQYVRPEQTMVAEMFLNFHDRSTKGFLRKYMENPSGYMDPRDQLKSMMIESCQVVFSNSPPVKIFFSSRTFLKRGTEGLSNTL